MRPASSWLFRPGIGQSRLQNLPDLSDAPRGRAIPGNRPPNTVDRSQRSRYHAIAALALWYARAAIDRCPSRLVWLPPKLEKRTKVEGAPTVLQSRSFRPIGQGKEGRSHRGPGRWDLHRTPNSRAKHERGRDTRHRGGGPRPCLLVRRVSLSLSPAT